MQGIKRLSFGSMDIVVNHWSENVLYVTNMEMSGLYYGQEAKRTVVQWDVNFDSTFTLDIIWEMAQ